MKKKLSLIITTLLVITNLVGCGTKQGANAVKDKV